MANIKSSSLADAIMEALEEYEETTREDVKKAAKKTAGTCIQQLKSTSPKQTGGYARGWTYKMQTKGNVSQAIVYNEAKPGLAHLLEHGYTMVNGQRSPSYPHVAAAEQEAITDFELNLLKELEK